MSDNTIFESEDEDTHFDSNDIIEEIEEPKPEPKIEQKSVRQKFPRKISPLVRNAIKAQLDAKKTQEVEAQVPPKVQEEKVDSKQNTVKIDEVNDPTFLCNGCYYCNWSKDAYSNAMCKINYYSGR